MNAPAKAARTLRRRLKSTSTLWAGISRPVSYTHLDVYKRQILNIPYVLIGLYATKLAEAWRLAEGTEMSEKLLHLMDGFLAVSYTHLDVYKRQALKR